MQSFSTLQVHVQAPMKHLLLLIFLFNMYTFIYAYTGNIITDFDKTNKLLPYEKNAI